MSTIPAIAQAMLGTDAVAHVWTNNADGSPQVSVVWVIAHGDEILFGTDAHSEKAKNLRRDSRIILSIEDVERNERGYQRHLCLFYTPLVAVDLRCVDLGGVRISKKRKRSSLLCGGGRVLVCVFVLRRGVWFLCCCCSPVDLPSVLCL